MKILVVGNFGTAWDGSICDEINIADALEKLGHEVIRQQRDDENLKTGGTISNGRIDTDPDFILLAQYDHYPENMISNLKTSFPNSKIVYWAWDYQEHGQEWHERLIKESDLYLSKRIADGKYKNWVWLCDFAPSFLDRVESGTKDIDVLFTGSYLSWATERNETIKQVGERFNLVIHSANHWPQGNEGPVMDKDLPALYARARIVLSIDHTIEAGYWSDRTAQALACGSFVLHRWQPLSQTFFGNNIAYFYSPEDCVKKLESLLTPQMIAIRAEIARKGYEYAHTNLMVENRAMDLLTIVGSVL